MALDMKGSLDKVKLPAIPWAKLAKLTKVRKLLLAGVILGALCGSFVWFLYMPQTEKIASLKRDVRSAQANLNRLQQVKKNLRRFERELKETEIEFEQALRLLPDKEEIPALLTSISDLGAKSGLEFLLFRPGKEAQRNFYAEIPLSLEISGPYHNVATFFDLVSRLSRIVNIGDINMRTLEVQDDTVILRTNCTATTYKFIEPPKEDKKKKKR
jgi:type IV pilus assembly protein PilO